jgi:hypothetical protein
LLSSNVTGLGNTARDGGDEAGVCADALGVEVALCRQRRGDTASSAGGNVAHLLLGGSQSGADGKESESGGTHLVWSSLMELTGNKGGWKWSMTGIIRSQPQDHVHYIRYSSTPYSRRVSHTCATARHG